MAAVDRKLYSAMTRTTISVTGAGQSVESYFLAQEDNIRETFEDAVSRYR
jgi:hypothetical protein